MARSNWKRSGIATCGTSLILGVILSGCATSQPNPWESVEVSDEPATQPLDLIRFPAPASFSDEFVTFDLQGAKDLKEFQVAAETNTDIAYENAAQVDDLNRAVAHLRDAGQGQRVIADMRQEILEEERKRHMVEKFTYWVLLLLFGVAAVQ